MGRRWAWMGMVGVCALFTGCKEREEPVEQAAPVSARAPAPARPGAERAPARTSAEPVMEASVQHSPAPGQTAAPVPMATNGRPGNVAPGTVAPGTAPQAGGSTTQPTELGTPEQAPEGRVMIGLEAVQASEDEAWHQGAAKAARAAGQNESVPLEKVVIATGTVDGRVTRVEGNVVQLRDGEGNLYQLRIDKRSRGVRQGQPVPIKQLEEGTPVRASFDLVGDGSFARDIEVRR
ncbi:MAG TPA: hypothetical protein VF815_23875 [Myxococcaceae bacterium]